MSSSLTLLASLIRHIFVHCQRFCQHENISFYCQVFREQNVFRKNPLHLLTFHKLQLTFGMKNVQMNSFSMIFDHSSCMGAPQRKFSQLQSLKINSGGIENQQMLKITNVGRHRNIRKCRSIEFFVKYQRISLGFSNIN